MHDLLEWSLPKPKPESQSYKATTTAIAIDIANGGGIVICLWLFLAVFVASLDIESATHVPSSNKSKTNQKHFCCCSCFVKPQEQSERVRKRGAYSDAERVWRGGELHHPPADTTCCIEIPIKSAYITNFLGCLSKSAKGSLEGLQ